MDKPRWQMTMLHDVSDHDAAIMTATTGDTKFNLSVVGESRGGVRWAVLRLVWLSGCMVGVGSSSSSVDRHSTPREKM
jgi:adenine deaminase